MGVEVDGNPMLTCTDVGEFEAIGVTVCLC